MDHNLSVADISNRARELLCQLYDFQSGNLGKPSLERFFPVNLNQIVTEVMGWQIEESTMIGFLPSGHQIIGQSNYDEKKILIDVGDTATGERNFTLAHEIGHATLHSVNYACDAFATRVHSSKTNEKLVNADPRKLTLEREAQMFAAELLMPRKSVVRYFRIIFGRDNLWSESTRTQEIIRRAGYRTKGVDLKSVAKLLAREPGLDGGKNLSEFFGVSNEAMAVRLVRLGLIY